MTSEVEKLRASNSELRVALALAERALAEAPLYQGAAARGLDAIPNPRATVTLGEIIARALGRAPEREATAPRAKRARKRQMPRVCRDGHPELAY